MRYILNARSVATFFVYGGISAESKKVFSMIVDKWAIFYYNRKV